jgi:TRAP-type C4-dicarboxylate transport system substrate-binding protein
VAYAAEGEPSLRLVLPDSAPEAVWAVAQEFKQAITTRTDGTVKIEIARNALAYQDHEIVSVVSSGTIEIGGTTLNQFAYDVPLAGVFLQPFMFNFNSLIQAAARPGSEIRRLVDDEILYWTNTRVLWWQPMGSNIMILKGVLPDGASMANLSIGAPDDQSKELIRICGGEPYLMPTAELSSALESGKISAAITDILSVKAYDLWRVANTVINTQHAPSLYLIVINDRVWQGLSSDRKQVIEAAARELQVKTWDRFIAIEADAYAQAAQMG